MSEQRGSPDQNEWSLERRLEQGHLGMVEGIYRGRLEWAAFLDKQAQEARQKGEMERVAKLEAAAKEYRSWKPDHLA
jgi:hypothetical protein